MTTWRLVRTVLAIASFTNAQGRVIVQKTVSYRPLQVREQHGDLLALTHPESSWT